MPEQTLKEKTAKGLFWGGLSNFVQQVIGMFFGIVIARILSPDDYGLVAMLAIFTAIANTIMDSGFTTALINRRTIEHKDYNAVFWFNIFVGVGIYILLFFSAPLIAKFYNQPVLTNLSRLMFLSFVIAGTGIAHNAILIKKIMAKQRGIIDMSAIFCSGLIGLILALNGYAFWGLAIQQVSQTLISVLLRWFFSPWRPTFHLDFLPLKEMFGFSSRMLLTNIVSLVTGNVFSVILGRYYGKLQTGYYAQGNKWASIVGTVFTGMLQGVAQPVLVESKNEKERMASVFRKMIRFGAFIIFPVLFGFAFVGREFIIITIGEKWLPSVPFLQLFCISAALNYINYLYLQLLLALEKVQIIMWYTLFVCVCIILIAIAMSSVGIFPMLISYVSLLFLSSFGWHYFAHKFIGIRIMAVFKDLFPYLLIAVFTISGAWFVSKNISNIYICFVTKLLVSIILYGSFMWISNSVMFRESCMYIKQMIWKN